jgi:ABC-type Mn2+/Zn2+ transport system permease subunit
MSYFTDPLQYDFFVRALFVSVLIGALAGAIGPFVLVRKMAYIGQGMSQSILGGVALGVVWGIDMYIGAAIAAALSAALIYAVRKRGIPVDTSIGIVASTLFAIGVAVVSSSRDRRLNSANLLFGNVLGVDTFDMILVFLVTLLSAVLLYRNYKSLLAVTHNSSVAGAHGVKSRLMEFVYSALLAMIVVTALRVLGVLLVAATLLIPAATATLTFKRFQQIMTASIMLGISFALIGLFLSFHQNIASGPAMVLVGAAVFTMILLTSKRSAS